MTAQQNTPAAPDNSDLDQNAMAAIRDLLASEPQASPQPVAERVADKVAAQEASDAAGLAMAAAPAPAPRKKSKTKRASRPAVQGDGLLADLKAKITGYRPTPRHIVIAVAVLFVLFRPWLVLALVFLLAFITTGIFLILGYDGFWHRVMGVARWYARRHPSRSVELHRKLDSFAMKFDGFLDRFPEGSVDGLYLPDFGDLAEAEARHDEALDRRFDSLRESEA